MLRIQPLSITAKNDDSYLIRFERLVHEHPECGVGEYEKPNGFVEYPYEFESDSNGLRAGKGMPKQFDWDTHDDGTGALWLKNAVSLLDSAKIEGIELRTGAVYKPFEIVVAELNENLEQQYLVSFDSNGSTVRDTFVVTGDDQQLNIHWNERSHKVNQGQRWTLENADDSSAEGMLIRAIAMLHAARNFIYGPDRQWNPATS